jgi:stage III sporulation protein AC
MGIDLIFRIAAIGVLISVLNQVLIRSGREEYAMMTTLAGIIVVLTLIIKEIVNLFDTVKALFNF